MLGHWMVTVGNSGTSYDTNFCSGRRSLALCMRRYACYGCLKIFTQS